MGPHIIAWKIETFPGNADCVDFDIGDRSPKLTSCSYVLLLATCHDVSRLCYASVITTDPLTVRKSAFPACLSWSECSPREAYSSAHMLLSDLSVSQQKEEDFETVLTALGKDIQKRQIRLLEIRLREKRSTLLATIYTLLAWVIYITLWYLDILPQFLWLTAGRHAIVRRVMRGLPVFVGPIMWALTAILPWLNLIIV